MSGQFLDGQRFDIIADHAGMPFTLALRTLEDYDGR